MTRTLVLFGNGARMRVDLDFDAFQAAYTAALAHRALIVVGGNGRGRKRALNPYQIVYFEAT